MKHKLGFMLRDLHNETRVNITSEVQIIYLGHLGTLYNHWNLSHVSVWTFRRSFRRKGTPKLKTELL